MITSQVSIEPITLAEAKSHLNITDGNSDGLTKDFITVAREYVENIKSIALTTRTKELFLDRFPGGDILIYDSPVQSIFSITYVDSDGDTQTVAAADYSLDKFSDPVRIENLTGWPGSKSQNNAVTVKYVSGYNHRFTATAADVITDTAHGFDNGHKVQVKSSTTLPGGLSVDTDYYIISSTTDTYELSVESGGTKVDITDTGTGVHEIDLVPFTYKETVGMATAELYRNREDPKLNGVNSILETLKVDAFS